MSSRFSLADWLLLAILSVLWGGAFSLVATALRELPPLAVVAGRVGSAAIVMALWCLWRGPSLRAPLTVWMAFLVMGILNSAIPNSLMVFAQTAIPAGSAAILNATSPLFSVLLAHLLTAEEKITLPRLFGVVTGIAGVGVLTGPSIAIGSMTQLIAVLASLGAACSFALAAIWSRRFRGLPSFLPAIGQVATSALIMAPASAFFDRWWTLEISGATVLAILGLGILATAIGFAIYFRLLQRGGPTTALLVTFLMPPSALLIIFAALGEPITLPAVIGMALIFAGILAIDGRLLPLLRLKLAASS